MTDKHNTPSEQTQPGQTAGSDTPLATATFAARRRLPETRHSITHKFNIAGHEGYLIVGLYDDGTPGEMFFKLAKEGSTMAGLADTIGILTSLCLQHGVPVETLANKLRDTRYEPAGETKHAGIPRATSLSDYIFRWLSLTFETTA
ncbi:TSCPD domain-containing protein [Bythopirellula goksoeyrii]|uniref:ribonucleoside-diphosphate reductase n=1 Tax=Bythopirellula goksoeyrii TaxID=1400387 RepID=A0A5B9QB00_9BACT|nr:hypothetical protein [Bythopirellula goksoeyrii]QEG36207.1 Vitamin B12-dependent ribonucleotide reductase [Bythopirellula goksoeyrii]